MTWRAWHILHLTDADRERLGVFKGADVEWSDQGEMGYQFAKFVRYEGDGAVWVCSAWAPTMETAKAWVREGVQDVLSRSDRA